MMTGQNKGENKTMCSSTKHRIAATLRQMMMERPFQKITVQTLMDASGMKRQSFYYHFQDTRDVLQWICRQELILPLESSELDFEAWLLDMMERLDRDRSFYRRMFAAGNPELTEQFGEQVVFGRVAQLLYGTQDSRQLEAGQCFTVEFAARALTCYLVDFVNSRRPLDHAAAQANFRCLLTTFCLDERMRGE